MTGTQTADPRGRIRVYLGRGHPLANSGGWQWRNRLTVAQKLGRRLDRREHVHHEDRTRSNDDRRNLRVLAASEHGRLHAAEQTARGGRGSDGRFRRIEPPEGASLGSTLVAARQIGRESIGIEMDEHQCVVVARRVREVVAAPRLFEEDAATQAGIFDL